MVIVLGAAVQADVEPWHPAALGAQPHWSASRRAGVGGKGGPHRLPERLLLVFRCATAEGGDVPVRSAGFARSTHQACTHPACIHQACGCYERGIPAEAEEGGRARTSMEMLGKTCRAGPSEPTGTNGDALEWRAQRG